MGSKKGAWNKIVTIGGDIFSTKFQEVKEVTQPVRKATTFPTRSGLAANCFSALGGDHVGLDVRQGSRHPTTWQHVLKWA